MFRLEHPMYLIVLLLLLVLVALQTFRQKQILSKLEKLGSNTLWKQLIPSFDEKKLRQRSYIWLAGITLIILSLANPQWGTRKEKIEIKSTDIFLALDISNSMQAEDIKPSRLERSKLWAESFIRSISNDRIGTVLFAGHAFLQSPLTIDYGSVTMFMRSAHPDLITLQGTNISDAINTCLENFSKNDEAQKIIVLLTDGEDHDELANDIAEKAKAKNVSIFTIGTATKEGGLIPVRLKNMEDYKRDETGKPIQTKLNEDILVSIAQESKGAYYHISQGDAIINEIKNEAASMTKQRVAERAYSEYESYFPYLLFPGIILLLLEFLMQYNYFDRFKKSAL